MDELEGKLFSIDTSNSFIFDLLRSKIYQDPILAICREVCCNARDANRFVNKTDPIEVSLPTKDDLFFKVKDVGPGISPDLIENVFIKYASSTKRSDDNQTGGFGLGAKTPFAYTDSFTVQTIVENIKYQYLCYIDETKFGKITLLDSHNTVEENGTTIIVPVKSNDVVLFRNKFAEATKFWSIKPIVNANFAYEKFQTLSIKDDWFLMEQNSYSCIPIALVDEIPYSLTHMSLNSRNYTPVLKFSKSEVSISPNRENLHLDDKTRLSVSEKFNLLRKELSEYISKDISEANSLIEAIHKYNCHSASFSGFAIVNGKWKDLEVPKSNNFYTTDSVVSIARSYKKTSLHLTCYCSFSDKYFINDLGLTKENYKEYEKSLASYLPDNSNIILTKDLLESDKYLKYLDVKNLSEIVSKIESANKPKTKLYIYKYILDSGEFNGSSIKVMEEDTNKKIICFLEKKKSDIKSNLLSLIEKEKNVSFYGIDVSLKDKFYKIYNYKDVDSYIKELIIENAENIQNYFYNKSLYSKSNYYRNDFMFFSSSKEISIHLKTNCKYFEKIEQYNKEYVLKENYFYEKLFEISTKYEINIELKTGTSLFEKLYKDLEIEQRSFLNKYPLLAKLKYNVYDTDYANIAEYIDLINLK